MAMTYPYNPSPQTGVLNPYGAVPGVITPPTPYNDLSQAYPGLNKSNALLSGDINAQLGGQLSPGTLKAMQDFEAQYAIRSGMPGSNAIPGTLNYNRGDRDIGRLAEDQVRAGQAAYNQTIPTISRTQTVSPELQTNIAETNALDASAPNPQIAGSYAQQLFDRYMNLTRGPGGGTGGRPTGLPSYSRSGGGARPGEETDALGFPISRGPAFNDYGPIPVYGPTGSTQGPQAPTSTATTDWYEWARNNIPAMANAQDPTNPAPAGTTFNDNAAYAPSDFGDPWGEFNFEE